ncbi:MarR family winged helix-turn-helix transcriptional regulator [Pseudonocardia sp. RS11V-5]|uniref:MarR family winged helix-turn-helix transcriptional regulator n=1 Tax=Pseudonocardia terrae TaxID=2905831 RepID=UPI001E293B67|nr:MarR family winged helix-turn-helix transcriptional regulator [Pseudonocardia terrae]MCE3556422.1 MarR family winged helix-turn-helix transcriptional regulator [Pseudonocardia terrae]
MTDGARRDELVRLLQGYATESARLAQAFSEQHGLHTTDLHALIAVLNADRVGEPLTAGRLGAHLGLSSGATTALVDRLERHDYVRRGRDERDRRRVVLRYGPAAAEIGRAFFGPLGAGMDVMLEGYDEAELAAVVRFLAGVTELVAERRRQVGPLAPS